MIRVMLADDHEVVRHGLRRLVDESEGMSVVGEAADGESLLAQLPRTPCEVVVLDLGLPGRSGLDVIKTIRAQQWKVSILVLSMQPEDQYAMRILAAGADGYLSKGRSGAEVVTAIRAVATEGRYLTPTLASLVLAHGESATASAVDLLTDRELDVLVLIGGGRRPSDVASDLNISPSTVSTHINRMKKKLGVSSLGDLVQAALKNGLVDLGGRD